MPLTKLLALLVNLSVVMTKDCPEDSHAWPVVTAMTTKGVVEGSRMDISRLNLSIGEPIFGVADVFRGIPYAEPPVGRDRFKIAKEAKPWNGVLNATKYGPKCPQQKEKRRPADDEDEDCLTLNVFTSDVNGSESQAVMVWIHDGALRIYSASRICPWGIIYNMVRRGVVVVSIQYRLGFLGFFTTYTEAYPANLGLRDQVLALRWVQREIHNFGGDPSRVTLFGTSAGAVSIGVHTLSPMSRGLFSQAIMSSGSALNPFFVADKTRDPSKVVARNLCGFEGSWEESITSGELDNCLRAASWQNISRTSTKGTQADDFWPVTIDGKAGFLPDHPVKLAKLRDGSMPIIIGTTPDEMAKDHIRKYIKDPDSLAIFGEQYYRYILQLGSSSMEFGENAEVVRKQIDDHFRPQSTQPAADNHVGWLKLIQRMLSSRLFHTPAVADALLHLKTGNTNVRLFSFDYFSPALKPFYPPGYNAILHSENKFYETALSSIQGITPHSPEDRPIIDTMGRLWTNFAKSGNPTPNSQAMNLWSALTEDNSTSYYSISLNSQMKSEFWRDDSTSTPLDPRLTIDRADSDCAIELQLPSNSIIRLAFADSNFNGSVAFKGSVTGIQILFSSVCEETDYFVDAISCDGKMGQCYDMHGESLNTGMLQLDDKENLLVNSDNFTDTRELFFIRTVHQTDAEDLDLSRCFILTVKEDGISVTSKLVCPQMCYHEELACEAIVTLPENCIPVPVSDPSECTLPQPFKPCSFVMVTLSTTEGICFEIFGDVLSNNSWTGIGLKAHDSNSVEPSVILAHWFEIDPHTGLISAHVEEFEKSPMSGEYEIQTGNNRNVYGLDVLGGNGFRFAFIYKFQPDTANNKVFHVMIPSLSKGTLSEDGLPLPTTMQESSLILNLTKCEAQRKKSLKCHGIACFPSNSCSINSNNELHVSDESKFAASYHRVGSITYWYIQMNASTNENTSLGIGWSTNDQLTESTFLYVGPDAHLQYAAFTNAGLNITTGSWNGSSTEVWFDNDTSKAFISMPLNMNGQPSLLGSSCVWLWFPINGIPLVNGQPQISEVDVFRSKNKVCLHLCHSKIEAQMQILGYALHERKPDDFLDCKTVLNEAPENNINENELPVGGAAPVDIEIRRNESECSVKIVMQAIQIPNRNNNFTPRLVGYYETPQTAKISHGTNHAYFNSSNCLQTLTIRYVAFKDSAEFSRNWREFEEHNVLIACQAYSTPFHCMEEIRQPCPQLNIAFDTMVGGEGIPRLDAILLTAYDVGTVPEDDVLLGTTTLDDLNLLSNYTASENQTLLEPQLHVAVFSYPGSAGGNPGVFLSAKRFNQRVGNITVWYTISWNVARESIEEHSVIAGRPTSSTPII